MATRNDILNIIKDDLKKYITVEGGYSFTPQTVNRGLYSYEDLHGKYPSLCFTFTTETPYEDPIYVKTYDDTDIKSMTILFYGFAKSDDTFDNTIIYNMAQDVETFLQSTSFTYYETITINNVEIKEAGPSDKSLAFIIQTSLVVNDDIP